VGDCGVQVGGGGGRERVCEDEGWHQQQQRTEAAEFVELYRKLNPHPPPTNLIITHPTYPPPQ
jgi:hypothetical protein